MKARVHVFYREGVFDPQGNTIASSLRQIGFSRVKGVRVGKAIDVEFDEASPTQVRHDLQKMCDTLLANPVIESYQFEFVEE